MNMLDELNALIRKHGYKLIMVSESQDISEDRTIADGRLMSRMTTDYLTIELEKETIESFVKKIGIDNRDRCCNKCRDGIYQETSIHDDIDGVLHCSNCGHEVNRYE